MSEPTKEDLIKEIDFTIEKCREVSGLTEQASSPIPRKILIAYGFIRGLEHAKFLLQCNTRSATMEEIQSWLKEEKK